MARKTVVVVDDDDDMRLLVQVTVEAAGDYQVVAALEHGLDAVEELDRLNPPPVPDVVVLDNRMPVMGGTEAAARMLADYPDLPIVLFTAFLDADVEALAADIGIAACLAKTDYDQLPKLLDRLTAA